MTRLLIISHTAHYHQEDGTVVGWGPTVRELNHLASLFTAVTHIAPLHSQPPPSSSLPYTAPNVTLRPVSAAGGAGIKAKLGILTQIPGYWRVIQEELRRADAVHVRCPANISLVALFALMFSSQPRLRWVKYAGNWCAYPNEAFSYKLQRALLRWRVTRSQVTVNGRWPTSPAHVHSFNNPSLSAEDIAAGQRAAKQKQLSQPLNLFFAGRLEDAKGVPHILEICEGLQAEGVAFALHLAGDGSRRPFYERWVREAGMETAVTFHGWLPRPKLADFYAQAHFFLLPSASEGWPKVLSEAMAYGAVPLASAVSSIPQILAKTGAGLAIPAEDPAAYVQAICDYLQAPQTWQNASQNGVAAAQQFTYAHYLTKVATLFNL